MTDCYVGWKGWHGADFGRFGPEDATLLRPRASRQRYCLCSRPEGGELGYGNGAFAGWVRKAGGHWVGREAIPELQRRATEAGFEVIASEADFSNAFGPGTLDLIVAFDVIEHLEIDAIRSFFGEAKEALRSGGLLLLRFPQWR